MARRIKILFTITNFQSSGSGRVVYDIIKRLDRKVFDPEICCFHKQGEFFKEIEKLNIKVHVFEFTVPYRPFLTLPLRIFKIARFFKSNKFDIIHSWHWSSDFTEPLAAKLAGVPFIYTKKSMGWGNKSWLWRTKLSSKVIAINTDMISRFFNKTSNVDYIPLGVDTSFFKPQTPNAELRSELDINPETLIVITVANLVAVKGIEVLINAVNLLNDYNITTLIVGNTDSQYGTILKRQYNSDKIRFMGGQPDVRQFLNIADIFVIPTLEQGEGLPIAPLEAMSSECLVIGSDVPGVRDILSEFKEFLFEPNNAEALAYKIDYAFMHRFKLESMRKSMRKVVVNTYDIDRFIKALSSVYIEIID